VKCTIGNRLYEFDPKLHVSLLNCAPEYTLRKAHGNQEGLEMNRRHWLFFCAGAALSFFNIVSLVFIAAFQHFTNAWIPREKYFGCSIASFATV
jgi:hypothetical protein